MLQYTLQELDQQVSSYQEISASDKQCLRNKIVESYLDGAAAYQSLLERLAQVPEAAEQPAQEMYADMQEPQETAQEVNSQSPQVASEQPSSQPAVEAQQTPVQSTPDVQDQMSNVKTEVSETPNPANTQPNTLASDVQNNIKGGTEDVGALNNTTPKTTLI